LLAAGGNLRVDVSQDDARADADRGLDDGDLGFVVRGRSCPGEEDRRDRIRHQFCHERERPDAHAHREQAGLAGHMADRLAGRTHAGSKLKVGRRLGRRVEVEALHLRRIGPQREKQRLFFQREVHERNAQRRAEAGGRLGYSLTQANAIEDDGAGIRLLVQNQMRANGRTVAGSGELVDTGTGACHKESTAIRIARMWSGVLPQQPPRTRAPSPIACLAKAPMSSGLTE
jgi:hypothetical protein